MTMVLSKERLAALKHEARALEHELMADILEANATIDNPRNGARDIAWAVLVALGLWACVIALGLWFFR